MSEAMDKEKLGSLAIAVLVAAEVPNFYSGLLPSEMTIKRFAAKDEDKSTLKSSMLTASIEAAFFVGAASYAAQSFVPVILGGTMMALSIWRYSSAIANPHKDAVPIDDDSNTGDVTPKARIFQI